MTRARAMSLDELLKTTRILARQTGQNALKRLFSSGQIQRLGKGVSGNPYRYFASAETRKLRMGDF